MFPRREPGVSSLTERSPGIASAAMRASAFSSKNVSVSATLGTVGSIISPKALNASRWSPIIMTSEWGMVPLAALPTSSAPLSDDTPSHPPMKEERSMTGAMAGCIRLTPNEMTGRLPAASLHRAAIVATPLA